MVILAIGVQPDTGFLKGSGIQLNQCGAIVTDVSMNTNWEHIYAAGDAVEVTHFVTGQKTSIPLAGPANRQGRIAADNISGISSTYKHTQGTAVCKLFELTAAVTGLNEKTAKKFGIPYLKSYTESASHAGYYPGAQTLNIKMLFSPGSGQVLGAQVIGRDGVDKRIDVLATAVRHKLSVFDLTELELAYAPPYGSAKDPVNMAGFVAENILRGQIHSFHVEDIQNLDSARHVLLDVRTPKETGKGIIRGALTIPVDELRQRLGELDKKKEVWIYCQVGMRGYLAARILSQRGFTVKNLSGGYSLYCCYRYDVPL
jgi:rhodanese-related sulfurtransferase